MTGIFRFVGILNAAIWLGGSVFFTFVAGRAPFGPEMKTLLGPAYFPYYSGAIAQVGVSKFFTFQTVCCIVALIHLAAEWLYQPRRGRRQFLVWMLLAILGITFLGDYWMRPKMKRLHAIKYAQNYPAPQRDAAAHSFTTWHVMSSVLNLFVLGGLGIYLFKMTQPLETPRFTRPAQSNQFRS